nr:MauE/DoxX family redox-associated membrane protein [uncultured Pseudodesulfovibrio sp.]
MKSFFASQAAYIFLRVLIGGLFVYAGVLKLLNPYDFAITINMYGLVTWRMSTAISYIIPCIEIMSGLGLILNVRGALALVVAQLLGFMAVLLYALHIGLDADCGCFGTPRTTDSVSVGPLEAIIRDVGMLTACATMYWQRKTGSHTPRSVVHKILRKA